MNLLKGLSFLVSIIVRLAQLRVKRENSLGTGWNANEAGEFVKVVPDYNETQMWSRPVPSCPVCRSTLFCWHCDPFGIGMDDTQMTLIEVCDLDGERGSVSIAVRRLKRIRCTSAIWELNNVRRRLGRKCNEAVSRKTLGAGRYLRDNRRYIVAEGEREQQEIHETQMMRLGENDEQVEEWRDDFETWPTFAEQIRSTPRFNRHQREW